MRTFAKSIAPLFVLTAIAFAQTVTTYQTTWNGIARSYNVYVPADLPDSPALIVSLHGTTSGTQTATLATALTACQNSFALAGGQQQAFRYLLVCPVATFKTTKATTGTGSRFWETDTSAAFFNPQPDDQGFLRWLILQMELPVSQGGFNVNPQQVAVQGCSSGAMMAQAMGKHSSDLVAVVGAVAGRIWIGTPETTVPTMPVSVIETFGDADKTIPPCGGFFQGANWGEGKLATPPIQTDIDFWTSADGLPSYPAVFCTATGFSGVYDLDIEGQNAAFKVVRIAMGQHGESTFMGAYMVSFFVEHWRKPPEE